MKPRHQTKSPFLFSSQRFYGVAGATQDVTSDIRSFSPALSHHDRLAGRLPGWWRGRRRRRRRGRRAGRPATNSAPSPATTALRRGLTSVRQIASFHFPIPTILDQTWQGWVSGLSEVKWRGGEEVVGGMRWSRRITTNFTKRTNTPTLLRRWCRLLLKICRIQRWSSVRLEPWRWDVILHQNDQNMSDKQKNKTKYQTSK